jgi:hypothetical protein
MFMKKKFILGVLYLSAATAQGTVRDPAMGAATLVVDAAEPTEVVEFATNAEGSASDFAGEDSMPSDAAARRVV